MTIWRCYFKKLGGHVHCRIFCGPHEGALGKCGDLTFRAAEFTEFARVNHVLAMDFCNEMQPTVLRRKVVNNCMQCSKCKRSKPLEEFRPRDKNRRLHSWCIDCKRHHDRIVSARESVARRAAKILRNFDVAQNT